MKVLITGGTGQLGFHLQAQSKDSAAGIWQEALILTPGRNDLDLSCVDSITSYLDEHKPDCIINAAAYTAVDKAESELELATAINHDAVRILAAYSQENGCPLIQVSTDFVFNGEQGKPYAADAPCEPLGIYGETKRAGERAALLSSFARVVRTSWVYSEHGANFVKTMLRLARERDQLSVVADQVGSPTYAANLASFIWRLLNSSTDDRVFHCCDAGVCSWYDFAQSIFEISQGLGVLTKTPALGPIPSEQYPTPAKRPHYSVLDCSASYAAVGLEPQHWRHGLAKMLSNLKAQEAQ